MIQQLTDAIEQKKGLEMIGKLGVDQKNIGQTYGSRGVSGSDCRFLRHGSAAMHFVEISVYIDRKQQINLLFYANLCG